MNNLFDLDSPVMQKLSLLMDLLFLNFLWLICSLPVVTIGASTTALHAVVQKYVSNEDSGIVKPFFRAFCKNFRQSTMLWIPVLLLIAVLVMDLLYLFIAGSGAQSWLWIPFVAVCVVTMVLITYGFPLIARYENDTATVIRNSFLLVLTHFIPSLAVLAVNALPWVLLLLYPEVFIRTSIVWVLVGGSLIAYISNRIQLPIFRLYDVDPANDTDDE